MSTTMPQQIADYLAEVGDQVDLARRVFAGLQGAIDREGWEASIGQRNYRLAMHHVNEIHSTVCELVSLLIQSGAIHRAQKPQSDGDSGSDPGEKPAPSVAPPSAPAEPPSPPSPSPPAPNPSPPAQPPASPPPTPSIHHVRDFIIPSVEEIVPDDDDDDDDDDGQGDAPQEVGPPNLPT